jgi:hypothetical protein
MKKMTVYWVLALLWASTVDTFAQSTPESWAGIYNSKYGELRLAEEVWPGGRMVIYGDYGNNGTMVGVGDNGWRVYRGDFHNGKDKGKFYFEYSGFRDVSFLFTGFWGYQSDNRNSTRDNDRWNGSKTQSSSLGRIRTAVWSGEWSTNFGAIYLEQIGNEISGTYGNGNRLEGFYDPATRTFNGGYVQGTRRGFFEFVINGNDFTGKWGWTVAMTEGAWNGSKRVKTNAPMPQLASQTSTNSNLAGRYRVRVQGLYIALMTGVFAPDRDIAGNLDIKMMGKSGSGPLTEIRARDGRASRIWQATTSSPLRIRQDSKIQNLGLRTQNNQIYANLGYAGRHVIDRTIEFDINSTMANNNLELQLQSNITSVGTVSNQVLPASNLRIKISELEPGKTYYIMNKEGGASNYQDAFFTFTIEKI